MIEYKVSGKPIDVRMKAFVNQVVPSIYSNIRTEHDRIQAIISIHTTNATLLTIAQVELSDNKLLLEHIERVNTLCWDIINKDIGTWECNETQEYLKERIGAWP